MSLDQLIGAAGPGNGADLVKNSSVATFMADVIEASREVPVIVDFWAPWCGPCKTLGPQLEKAVRGARGAVRMVKINIDENQQLAQQMRIQSIPAVYAFKDGRPVDGFVGAVPETQIKQFVARLSAGAGPSPIEEALEMAKEAVAAGDLEAALDIYGQILQHEPENAPAFGGLASCLVDAKNLAEARAMIDGAPPAIANHSDVAGARAKLELAEAAEQASGALGELKARLAANPKDHEARLELSTALFGTGEREAAIDELLEIVKRDREWNEQAARKQLVKFFEAMGPTDPLTLAGRRRLSSILFS